MSAEGRRSQGKRRRVSRDRIEPRPEPMRNQGSLANTRRRVARSKSAIAMELAEVILDHVQFFERELSTSISIGDLVTGTITSSARSAGGRVFLDADCD